ncbi:MAG: peptidase T [Chloroflexaceae bacterium]|nr:peptidase T [Chloroflexaceae bacterium]
MPMALILHGGAGRIPDKDVEATRAGCIEALQAGWVQLERYESVSAVAACEATVSVLEDHPVFNAGIGSVLNAEGAVELDAAMMDGRTLAYGGVGAVRNVRNPIRLARQVLQGPATLLVGTGAEQFGMHHGSMPCDPAELIHEGRLEQWQRHRDRILQRLVGDAQAGAASDAADEAGSHDTVGAIALDHAGELVAANSTGGMLCKLPGRVGDTPMIGCGLYADASVGACVCTGWGESIARLAMARRAVEMLEHGYSPQKAAEFVVAQLSRRISGGRGGCIILDPLGRVGLAWSTPRMAYAYRIEGQPMVCGLSSP